MKTLKNFVGILGLCAALNAGAQSVAPPANSRDARANELQARYMTAVKAELTSKLDTKTAAAGQPITAKTVGAVTLADGTAIPEGTKLVGHVVEVRPVSEQRAGSLVTVTFDQAEVKGKMIPVRSMIRAMSTPGAVAQTPVMAGNTAPMGGTGGRVGDPTMGGPIGNTRGGVGNNGSIGGVGGGGIDGVGGIGGADTGIGGVGGVGGPGGGMGGPGGGMGVPGTRGGRPTTGTTRTMGTIPPVASTGDVPQKTAEGGETVNQAPKPTGVPGVMLLTNPAADFSGTLMEYGKNIHLDSGIQMTLGLIAR